MFGPHSKPISAVPALFKADFGLFRPFRLVLTAGRYDLIWPIRPDSSQIGLVWHELKPSQRESEPSWRESKKKKTICCLFLIRWFKFVIIIRCELFCNIALTLLNFAYILITQSIHTRCVKCAKCQIFGTFGTPNTKNPILLDVPNVIIFATYEQCCCIFTTVRTEMV